VIDPDNQTMRYNFACALCVHLNDIDGALDLLRACLTPTTRSELEWTKVDPDFDPLRGDPRFKAMIAEAEAQLAAEEAAAAG
jgi:adenylate cyclase